MPKKLSVLLFFLAASLASSPASAKTQKGTFEAAPPPPAGQSLVYVYRIKVPPSMRSPAILVDGEKIMDLSNNSYGWFYIGPGSHVIKTRWGLFSDVPDLESVFQTGSGQTLFVRLEGSVRSWGLGRTKVYTGLKEVPEEEARQELQKVKKISLGSQKTQGPSPDSDREDGGKTVEAKFTAAPPPPAGYGVVYLYRPDCPPIMRSPKIIVDDKEVLKLSNKTYSWFYVKAGHHKIGTSWGKIYKGVPRLEVSLHVTDQKATYLRLGGGKIPQGSFDAHTSNLDEVTTGLAEKELAKIKKYSPADLQTVD